ncbi:MAG: hypothetical protein Q8R67_20195 [Rhodoferax sp.]|nr:hypothetical protein [Rhodoferax sp.]MDP3653998.1 hypothetical protein [Rhodoferax sp.]
MSSIPAQAEFAAHVLGPTVLMGLGLGLMLMTATHTAMDGVPPQDAGLASGLFNTARQLGAALGIAGLSTLAQGLAHGALATQPEPLAMLQGYHGVFVATAVLSALAAFVSLTLRRVA